MKEARRRREVFNNLDKYLGEIVRIVKEVDEDAQLYLFGSVVEGRNLLSSDIDVLIVTNKKPGEVIAKLWSNGVVEPFEIHVIDKELLEIYRRHGTLKKIT